ncbi:MAG: excinuclease ABC subunit UvrB [Candidatus Eisenbacteria bacterium]|nr:excinuclease ABC subunit UvrB [Candidatus Eisenbacteria bacterium]
MKRSFKLTSGYEPRGDQSKAIDELSAGLERGEQFQTLLGVTGSGKTFTMANVVARLDHPALVISHNKTLAAQLFAEFKAFFPENAVEYFVSYYDYYQPEAYVPVTDTYIEKDADINDEIDRLRLRATTSLLERRDVLIVASVSCIYGIGSPEAYSEMLLSVDVGDRVDRNVMLRRLVDMRYDRNDYDFARATFRVRGDVVEVRPSYEEKAIRIELFGDEIERIAVVDLVTHRVLDEMESVSIYPAKHFVTTQENVDRAIEDIEVELQGRLAELRSANKLLEAQRLEQRTRFDIEMMREMGYCSGIENYSRHLSGRAPGERPAVLLDYFPDDFILFIDESHVAVPQLRAMFRGDRARKETLVKHGFRLPSALDNRPLKFDEFERFMNHVVFVSATPGDYELSKTEGVIVEQIIRPTGLVDPEIIVRPVEGQVDDLMEEIRVRAKLGERVLVTTLTKRMAEDLTDYLNGLGVRVRYLHSDIDALGRVEIIRGLRLGEFDVLVGINLLREGLDLPEVSLVAVLDADKEGFLRSDTSLIQTAGRAARNLGGKVILYADRMTGSMERAIAEMERRRRLQVEYNDRFGITPTSIVKSRDEIMRATAVADAREDFEHDIEMLEFDPSLDNDQMIALLEEQMMNAAARLEFEKAASLRDRIDELKMTGQAAGGATVVSKQQKRGKRGADGRPLTGGRAERGRARRKGEGAKSGDDKKGGVIDGTKKRRRK